MRNPGRKCFGGFIAIALGYITLSAVGLRLQGKGPAQEQEWLENKAWVGSSKSWITKQVCEWLGLCGVSHLRRSGWTWDKAQDSIPPPIPDFSDWWRSSPEDPSLWTSYEKSMREIPQYVLDYAPYVHLFSGEQFWPCDIAEHVIHTSPHINYTKILDLDDERNLTNLNELNDYDGGHHGRYMYLQSDDNVEDHPRPPWLGGEDNIPTSPELDDEDDEAMWPTFDGVEAGLDRQVAIDRAGGVNDATTDDKEFKLPVTLVPSTDGRCGGDTGFTCKGSKFGRCCSIYGWCGRGEAHCGDPCEPLAGACRNPFEPWPRPHSELRKRARDLRGVQHRPSPAGRSSAPAVLIVVPKEDGIVDAFWFFFYSFNLGQTVAGIRFGNHIGDWEHTLIRFKNGKPDLVFLSEHNFGDAYAWHALEKYLPDPAGDGRMLGTWSNATASTQAKRPVVYSAVGSHAMYATPGLHPYILPWGILHDQTDRGPLWDPTLNLQAYTWDIDNRTVRASTTTPKAPTEWFHFAGHWGDKFYPLADKRQYRFFGQYHYVNGPTGPKFKNLEREKVCQRRKSECHIRHWVTQDGARRLQPEEGVELGGLPGGNYTGYS